MRCEVVAIGTELLLGQIVDTNSSWIGEQLALAGIDSHFQVKVGDNSERMESCLRLALERSDAVICCGGLGPTQDDITREVIARVMGVALERDAALAGRIRAVFEARGRTMAPNNLRQADVPAGATPIAEMPGTAPGLVCPVGGRVIYALPGVPHEMREMMRGTVLPDLRRRAGGRAVIRSRVLRTWGMSESGLAEALAGRIAALDGAGNPTLAFQASGIEGIKVRITAKCADEDAAAAVLAAEEASIRALVGDVVFGVDDESMEAVVLDRLSARGLTLAVAEALTGGLAAARLSAVDPEMTVFRGATVSAGGGAAGGAGAGDAGRAAEAADRVRAAHAADVGIAAIAPDAGAGLAPGTVFLGVAMADGCRAETVTLPADRARLRAYAVISLLNLLRKTLDAAAPPPPAAG